MLKRLIILFFIYPSILFAQFTDDFEDGNISNWTESTVGRWAASDISSLNGIYSLHHIYNNASGDHDQVSIAIPVMDIATQNTSWRFRIKYTYNPSGGNNWSVFLMSDSDASQMYPGGTANGYALGVNYTGNDDTLRLWKVTSGVPPEIVVSTTVNWDDDFSSSTIVALEVIRTLTGSWDVNFSLASDFENLQNIGTGYDITYTNAGYFGAYYLYTASADMNLWLDDIYVGKEIKDTVSPLPDSLYILNSKTVKIEFSEKLDSTTAVDLINYFVDKGIGNPVSVKIDESNTYVELFFNKKFEDQLQYSISIRHVKDKEGNVIADTTVNFTFEYIKPESVEAISVNELLVQFSRDLDSLSAENILNYSLDNGIGQPVSADVVFNDSAKVLLQFGTGFKNKTLYNITIQNVADQNLDSMQIVEMPFLYFIPETFDIVINEIMADPSPVIGLPEVEYIEIYNTIEFEIDVSNWEIKVGAVEKIIPTGIISSGGHLILCDKDDEVILQSYGEVLGFKSFPSLANSGQTITIKNENGEIVTTVSYSDEWYKDDYKAEGGWSLEQIDPLNPCGGENNWIASQDAKGGTPGQVNSVNENNPDQNAPELLRISVIDDKNIRLYFNESIDSVSAMNKTIYAVDQGIGNPFSIDLIAPDYKSLVLGFENPIYKKAIYELEILGGIFDCAGNEIYDKNIARFAIPDSIQMNDLVVNEILFNPLPGGNDFIEIYNRSERTFDLMELRIAGYDEVEMKYLDIERITDEGYLIFPGEYYVLTENVGSIKEQYVTTHPDGFIQTKNLPSFNNDKGGVFLLDKWQHVIDNFGYSSEMHFPLLNTTEGVSLERINYDRPANDKTNWHSASELVGFATPAYENSQFIALEDIKDEVKIEPEIFSPDNDGFEDIANIRFTFNEPGYVANIKIFDSRGRLIRYLANNQLLGIDGVVSWDGLDEKNQKAPVGIYVVFIEIFNVDGNIKQFKKPVVVAAKY